MQTSGQSRLPTSFAKLCLLILPAVLSVHVAQATQESELTRQLDSLLSTIPYTTFEWVQAEGVSDRAAINIPIDLDGTTGWFQFDTGLDVTLVYGDIPVKRGWETHDGMYHVPSVRIGGIHLGPTWLRCDEDADEGGGVIGSLGLDLLVGYLVLIDYPGRRLSLLKLGDAPMWLLQRTSWTPGELRDAKFFLTVVLDGKTIDGLILDTGASAFHITVDSAKWVELTGHSGPDEASTHWKVRSWGKTITAIGAPAQGTLVIGSARLDNPPVFYLKEQPRLFAQWPFPATGLVGNAPFWDRVVVLDLGIRPRFGLVQ